MVAEIKASQITNKGVTNKAFRFECFVSNFAETFQKSQISELIDFNFKVILKGQVTDWLLRLYPKGNKEENKEYLSLYIVYLGSSDDDDAYVGADISILDRKQELKQKKSFEHYRCFRKSMSFGYSRFIEQELLFKKKGELLPGDKLTISCEILLDKVDSYCEKIKIGRVEDFEDFGMLYMNSKLSDITIEFNDDTKKIPAHKYILMKKSSVFADIFTKVLKVKIFSSK